MTALPPKALELIAASVDRATAVIAASPALSRCGSFDALHDACDANMLGGQEEAYFADPDYWTEEGGFTDLGAAVTAAWQRVIDARQRRHFAVVMRAVGNPDMRQDTSRPFAPTETVIVGTVEEAREEVRAYIARHNLGGGNFLPAPVTGPDGHHLGLISYNARFWPGKPQPDYPAEIRRVFGAGLAR